MLTAIGTRQCGESSLQINQPEQPDYKTKWTRNQRLTEIEPKPNLRSWAWGIRKSRKMPISLSTLTLKDLKQKFLLEYLIHRRIHVK